ncbi:MAG: glutamate--cysteine ligase [Desulforhopalus sp.]
MKKQLDHLQSSGTHRLLKGALHGIEKEGLRVDDSGGLSLTPHPEGLGSALTNANITTDFSESLLELITPVFEEPGAAVQFLIDLHSFTLSHLGDELIWAASMPCRITDPALIPVARYGSSNIGQMKYVYRLGLMHRYGKLMQSIAGIHYNFSLPDDFWRALQELQGCNEALQEFRSASYFKIIRNFRRHSWLLLYLFGASPALCDSFLGKESHNLQRLADHTLYMPYATSLRMSDLGYSTKVQSTQEICFNHLNTYIDTLVRATRTPYPPYVKIGVKVDGKYRQLNDTILQIENEHYSDIRPKRVADAGERPLQSLKKNGVEYIEVRNTDVNPFLPAGIDVQQALFLDTFLVSCLLLDEHDICPNECTMVYDNVQRVVTRGREPGLSIKTLGGDRQLTEVASALLDEMSLTGSLLDEVHNTRTYSRSVEAQKKKVEDAAQTPSAQVLQALHETEVEYTDWVLIKSREHKEALQHLSPDTERYRDLARRAKVSIDEQQQMEEGEVQSFDQFLAEFLTLRMDD